MRYAVYILKSLASDKFYIGHTNNLARRLAEHNGDRAGYTKKYQPWKLAASKDFPTRSAAIAEERHLKRLKNKDILSKIIAEWRSSTSGGS